MGENGQKIGQDRKRKRDHNCDRKPLRSKKIMKNGSMLGGAGLELSQIESLVYLRETRWTITFLVRSANWVFNLHFHSCYIL